MNKKKVIIYVIIAIAGIAGIIWAGGLFPLIDTIIIRPIVNILFIIYNWVGDFGAAIIIFTILLKLAMWPMVRKQLHQTRLMKKLQPEIAKIKKNSNGNKQLESMQTMELYKRYKIKPLSSFVTILIQLPIFIALFSAIKVIATPMPNDNLSNRAYEFVAYEGSIIKDIEDKQQAYLSDLTNDEIPEEEKTSYDYHPQLFGVINLEAKASDVFNGNFSRSALFMLVCTICACLLQFWSSRLLSSGQTKQKGEKKKKFKDLIQDAKDGKDVDQSAVASISSKQMSYIMPLMMFFIMFNLHGALAFYYFLNNVISVIQQYIILKKAEKKTDELSDQSIKKELKNIQEAKVIENKKTGTKITRISAKDNKKKRR